MNWKSVSLLNMLWKMLFIGALGGMLAHSAAEGLANVLTLQGIEGHAQWSALLVMSMVAGALLSPTEEIYHRYWRRGFKVLLVGALLGLFSGLIVLGVGWLVGGLEILTAATSGIQPMGTTGIFDWLAPVLTLTLLGLSIGLASSVSAGRTQRYLRRGTVGATAGFVFAGVFIGLVGILGSSAWAGFLGLSLWGAGISFTLFWLDKAMAKRWLRLLTGPGEDNIFPLDTSSFTLGKDQTNDIPLVNYKEVFPFHCRLTWGKRYYEVIDQEQNGLVMINYRQAQDQALRPGDLVKIGTALLQYGERK